jgi:hypothetical protein
MRAGDDLLIERCGAGLAEGLEPVESGHREDLDELPVTVDMPGQPFAQARHRGGQVPVLERRAIAQRSGLTLECGQIVPRAVDRATALEAARVLTDDLSGAEHHDPLGVGAHRGHLPDVATLDAVAIALEVHQAGGRDPAGLLGKAVERRRHRAQRGTFFVPDFDDLAIGPLGMGALARELQAARGQVRVELGQIRAA